VYAEADLVESWCEAALDAGSSLTQAVRDVDAWFSQSVSGRTRRDMLRMSGLRSQVQRDMKQELKGRYGPSATIIPLPPFGGGST
jgi:hypothetical protein